MEKEAIQIRKKKVCVLQKRTVMGSKSILLNTIADTS